MNILITGVAGFIGFHLAKKLIEMGESVVGIDNLNDYYDVRLKMARRNILELHDWWYGDITNFDIINYIVYLFFLDERLFVLAY